MADRYQDRPLSADGFGRGGEQHQRADNDPLAELARLIGQNNDAAGRGNASPPSNAAMPQNQFQAAGPEDRPAGGPPPWMQRANRKEIPREEQRDFQTDEPEQSHFEALSNALNRYGAQPPPVEQNLRDHEPSFDTAHLNAVEEQPDSSRYDDALFGQLNTNAPQDFHADNAFPDDPYAYQEDGYEDEEADGEEHEPKRRGGLMTVAAVLALAVIGTGAAFAYRTYAGSSHSGEPPIIRADNSPTKMVPTPQDGGSAKVPDRLAMGDGTEKLISREETPVDVNSRSISGGGSGGPRVVFPQLNQNSNPPSPSSVAPNGLPPANASNGTVPNSEPRKIRTLSVRGDQPDATASTQAPASPAAGAKAAAKTAARNAASPANANASANAPMAISPQSAQDSVPPPAAEPRARVAATNPAQTEPAASPVATSPAASGGGGYLVQISSQRNESDAQASFKSLQGKFPAVLGQQTPVIKRADLGEKGVYYRAMVGPFGTSDEAAQFCNSLRSAGGQCFVPRNQ